MESYFSIRDFAVLSRWTLWHLKPILDKLGIPSTELELDTTVPITQFATQLEALVEIIKGVVP